MQGQQVCLTGSSGFIGSQVVTDLLKDGYKVRALVRNVPRDVCKLEGVEYFEYNQLELALEGVDVFLHFAARNNDIPSTSEEFLKDNFDLTRKLICEADKFGIKKFIFVSTTRALHPKGDDWYSISKLKAEAWLSEYSSANMQTCILRLPPVYGPKTKNKLSKLERLPRWTKSFILSQVRAFTPIVSVFEVSAQVRKFILDSLPREKMISTPLTAGSIYWVFHILMNVSFVLLCIVLLPLLIIVSALVSLTSEGPIFFLQKRVGKHEKLYTCIKYRTMELGTKQAGTHLVSASSVTRVGGLLRKAKVDEFPQAINIVMGKMSLIGPRPCLPNQIDVIRERRALGVYNWTPGISGLAQVKGIDMSTPEKLAIYDQRYGASQSIIGDLKIVLQTAAGSGHGDLVKSASES